MKEHYPFEGELIANNGLRLLKIFFSRTIARKVGIYMAAS
jgi:hypothetical protein